MNGINNFVHVIIRVDDLVIARKFYTGMFSWKISEIQPNSNQIYFRITDEGDFMSGSIVEVEEYLENDSLFLYINVSNLENMANKVEKLGGKVLGDPFEVDKFPGRMLHIRDPSGNLFGLWSEI